MTKFEERLIDYVLTYKIKHFCYPFSYQIAEVLETNDKCVAKSIKKVLPAYPEKYLVTTRDHELFLQFEPGMTPMDLANKIGISYDNIMNHVEGIEKQGVKFKRVVKAEIKPCNVKPKRHREEPLIGIKVTSGTYKGKYGYINDDCLVVIHIDGVEKKLELFPSEYVEIKKG